MTQAYHQLVKRLLDGELSLSDLPPELRDEGAEALRLRVRPWVVWGGALAAAATVVLLLAWPPASPGGTRLVRTAASDSVYVRFVLYAPGAQRVAVAGI